MPGVAPSWTVSGASNSPVGELRSARMQTIALVPSIPENMPLFCSVTVASVHREGGEGGEGGEGEDGGTLTHATITCT